MLIMCDKCKKPAKIFQMISGDRLVITASCHGAREEMSVSKAELLITPGLHAQIDKGIGVAFRQAGPANG